MNTTDIGRQGEKLAAKYLKKLGYKILERNIHESHNELDIIAADKDYLVFVEVKKRKTYLLAAQSIDINNQLRVVKSSAVFFQKYPQYSHFQVRYDAVLFKDKSIIPQHLIDAWRVL